MLRTCFLTHGSQLISTAAWKKTTSNWKATKTIWIYKSNIIWQNILNRQVREKSKAAYHVPSPLEHSLRCLKHRTCEIWSHLLWWFFGIFQLIHSLKSNEVTILFFHSEESEQLQLEIKTSIPSFLKISAIQIVQSYSQTCLQPPIGQPYCRCYIVTFF